MHHSPKSDDSIVERGLEAVKYAHTFRLRKWIPPFHALGVTSIDGGITLKKYIRRTGQDSAVLDREGTVYPMRGNEFRGSLDLPVSEQFNPAPKLGYLYSLLKLAPEKWTLLIFAGHTFLGALPSDHRGLSLWFPGGEALAYNKRLCAGAEHASYKNSILYIDWNTQQLLRNKFNFLILTG